MARKIRAIKPSSLAKKLPHSVWLYLIGIVIFTWMFLEILNFIAEDSHNILLSGLYFVEFGAHEVSHIVMSVFPPIVTSSAGSIGEVLFTVLILVATIKGKAYFASVFAGLWVMLAMHNASRYMADARTQALPLIGIGDTVKHDWHFVFGELGWLNYDTMIGGTVTAIGIGIGVLALVWGYYLVAIKIAYRKASKPNQAK